MTAAIYARKSTDQPDVANEQRSVARQIVDARAFAARLGLPPIDDAHVYADDAVSGADVKSLHARARLIADVAAGRIDVVIMADMSRFSRREGHEVVAELKQIARKAAIYFFETGSRYVFGSIGENIANYAMAESNADYRRKISLKTRAAMRVKAECGEVLGAVPFGYRRDRASRKIYEPEAAVVRDIFERYAAGDGYKKIAKALNWKGVPTPRPRPGRRASWSISNVRSILLQPLYRGIARWNRLKQHDEDGNPILEIRAKDEHVEAFDPAWRIVDEAISDAVDARFADENRRTFGGGKAGAAARYLLSGGMLLCPACGGRFEALKGKYYVCATRRHAGKAVCENSLALRIDVMDDAVLRFLELQVLAPAFIDRVCALGSDASAGDEARTRLLAERAELTEKIKSLAAALAEGLDIQEVKLLLRTHQDARLKIERRLKLLPVAVSRAGLRQALEQRAEQWRDVLLKGYREEARFVVRQLIGPITLWKGDGVDHTFDPTEGYNPDDTRGKEGITWQDLGFIADVKPEGLMAGLPGALSLVAGAGCRQYRLPCTLWPLDPPRALSTSNP